MVARSWLVAGLVMLTLAGCLSDDTPADPTPEDAPQTAEMPENATFEAFVVSPAVHQAHGLYEPTIDVSNTGVIYISAHSTGLGQLPAPAYYSTDDGATWTQLPFAADQTSPVPGQMAGSAGSDEVFIVAGTDGTAWGVDISLHSFLINGWGNDGAEHIYYNPQAYDHAEATNEGNDCTPTPLKDRPWAAYANGTLFIVNNPGGGPNQIAAMTVPPAQYVDAATATTDLRWNLCASSGGGIPGIPDLRDDGFFAAPQVQGSDYIVVTGNVADIWAVEEQVVLRDVPHRAPAESDSTPSAVGRYGQAVFDATGALWIGAMNSGETAGGIAITVSTDHGATWNETRLRFDQPVSSMYMDGNKFGEGALLHWGQIDGAHTDWYMGHVFIAPNGTPELRNVMLAFDDGPEASRHVQGAAAGPDGRAYMVMSDISGNDNAASVAATGSTPLRVVVQQTGPVLPVTTSDPTVPA